MDSTSMPTFFQLQGRNTLAESALILSLISVLMHIYFIFMHKTTIDESKESEFKETPLPFV